MPSDDDDKDVIATGAIIAIVIGSITGFAICIGLIVIIVCILRHCNRTRSPGMVLQQQQPPYPHSWTTQYPPSTTSVSNYSPEYQSAPPPYTASAPGAEKLPPYT